MSERSVGILGVGSYVPDMIVTNEDLKKYMETSDEWIRERTGIRERRFASPEQATSDLATEAARRALQHAGVKAEEIDLIILGTVSPDMLLPSTACLVQNNIGAVNAGAFDLSAACAGFIYGLIMGSQMIKAGACKKVLVIGAETLTRIVNPSDRGTGIIFADGAGAAVLGETEQGFGLLSFDMGSDGSGGNLLCMPGGGSRIPATEESVRAGLHAVKMDGSEVFKFAVRIMGKTVDTSLAKAGLSKEDIDVLIPHQANHRIIQSAAKRIGVAMDKVVMNVDRFGNTSAGSVPLALDEAVKEGKINDGDTVVLVGFGAGLTWASCVLKWKQHS